MSALPLVLREIEVVFTAILISLSPPDAAILSLASQDQPYGDRLDRSRGAFHHFRPDRDGHFPARRPAYARRWQVRLHTVQYASLEHTILLQNLQVVPWIGSGYPRASPELATILVQRLPW